jgi:hypothetical protein
MTGGTCRTGIASPSAAPGFFLGFKWDVRCSILDFYVVFSLPLFVPIHLAIILPLFDLLRPVITLVSSRLCIYSIELCDKPRLVYFFRIIDNVQYQTFVNVVLNGH